MRATTQALIDHAALRHNLERARRAAPASRVLAVIKANGYGHGLVRVARVLQAADGFAVACIEEACMLREAGIEHPLVVLEGVFDQRGLAAAARHGVQVVVHSTEQLERLEHASLPQPVIAWLKIDTGMHRLGFAPGLVKAIYARLAACRSVRQVRVMTHLANADDRSDELTEQQLGLFEQTVQGLAAERSVANSAAILGWPATHCEWVRPGILLFGASPFQQGNGLDEGLLPVMTLSTQLIAVNQCKRGERVGYGGAWVCPEDMPVGVAAIGYGDGYPRQAGNGTPVLVNGRRAALVGRVSMDMVCIDLRGHPQAKVGDPVVLWGRGLPIEEVAACAQTIPYELLCRVTQRVQFVDQGEEPERTATAAAPA